MEIILLILSFVLLIAGLLGSVLPIIPGPPLSFTGLLVLHFSGRGNLTVAFLLIWAGITLVVTVGDYFLPSLMTKRFGGSRFAAIGSFLGLVTGIIFFPPFGMILGSFLGAFIGELILSRAQSKKALKAALGSLLAFAIGTGAKLIICSMMLFYAIRTLL
ncbi:MAG: DUF456 domain-containing protein [Defluviitaleaceae bacterium]|nr:DUF456 domain-containing protein [Defluviitaleaceae bacterium]MCL2835419.1 DUF456 domain-containing protein [Defluviitaleaceae bacterium]